MSVKIQHTENFAKLRENCSYYVDKTGFLEQFLCAPPDASLFTRPRRFGKTLFMSMLAEFFDIRKDSRKLFTGLRIAENENLCRKWMNQYPVVSLTLKGIDTLTYAEAINAVQIEISYICTMYDEVLEDININARDRTVFKNLMNRETNLTTLCSSLLTITRVLFQHYNKPVILLIDEYDVPIAKAAERGYYDEMVVFMQGFLSDALKTNPYLQFGILTGALRIIMGNLFTGLNNLQCFDISNSMYADVFGFTQDEVNKLLAESGLEEKRDIIREWYDGYHFGDRTDIYCPWSIMQYMADVQSVPKEKPKKYWVKTSGNELTKGFLGRIPPTIQDDIASLTEGKTIAVKINEALNYTKLYTDEDNFWTLLYLTGYLTPSSDSENCVVYPGPMRTVLAIPNKEVKDVFKSEIKSWFRQMLPRSMQQDFLEMFWNGDARNLEKTIGTMLLTSSSVHDYHYREEFYHSLLLGLLLLMYPVTSNREVGKGGFDLIVRDEREKRAAVIGLKRADSREELEDGVEKALQQIEERQYDTELKAGSYTQILHWGMAFFKKSCRLGARRAQE